MLEKVVDYFIKQFIGQYVESLNTEEISLGYTQSDVSLKNLILKQDALFCLTNLPFIIKTGSIGLIKLKIPLTTRSNEAFQIIIENVVIDTFLDAEKTSIDKLKPVNLKEVQSEFLNNLEKKWWEVLNKGGLSGLVAFGNTETSYFWSYLFSFLHGITKNLQIEFRNISINYSLKISTFKLQLESFLLSSFNSNQEGDTNEEMRKFFEVNQLTLDYYSDFQSDFYIRVVPDCNLMGKLTTRSSEEIKNKEDAKFKIELEMNPISVTMSDEVILSLLVIFNEISYYLSLLERSNRRPTKGVKESPIEWWKYAVGEHSPSLYEMFNSKSSNLSQLIKEATLSNRYVQYYENYLLNNMLSSGEEPASKKMTPEEFKAYSDEWHYERVKILRQLAMSRAAKKIHLMNSTKATENTSTSWSMYWLYSKWTGYSSTPAMDSSNEDNNANILSLLNAISLSEDVSRLLMSDGLLFSIKVTLSSASFRLARHHAKDFTNIQPLVCMNVKLLKFDLKLFPRYKALKVDASLKSLDIINEMVESHKGSNQVVMKKLLSYMVTSVNQKSQSKSDSFLRISYEVLPPNSEAQYRIDLKIDPLQIVYEYDLMNELILFLQRCSHLSKENISTSAKSHFEAVKSRTRQALDKSENSSSKRKRKEIRWVVDLDISAPNILIPEFHEKSLSSNKHLLFNEFKINRDAVLCNLGRFRFSNYGTSADKKESPHGRETLNKDSTRVDEIDDPEDEFQTPCASPVESEDEEAISSSPKRSSSSPFEKIYECYQMQLDDFKIMTGSIDFFIEMNLWKVPIFFDDENDEDLEMESASGVPESSLLSSICIVDKFSLSIILCRRMVALELVPKKWITSPTDYKLPIGLPNILISWNQRHFVVKFSNNKLNILKKCIKINKKGRNDQNDPDDEEEEEDIEIGTDILEAVDLAHSPMERNNILKNRTRNLSFNSPTVVKQRVSVRKYPKDRRRILINFIMDELVFFIDNYKKPLADITLKNVSVTFLKMSNGNTQGSLNLSHMIVRDVFTEIDSQFSAIFQSRPIKVNDSTASNDESVLHKLEPSENIIFLDPDDKNNSSENLIQLYFKWSQDDETVMKHLKLDLIFNHIEMIANPEFFYTFYNFINSLNLEEFLSPSDANPTAEATDSKPDVESANVVEMIERLYQIETNIGLNEFSFLLLDITEEGDVRKVFHTNLDNVTVDFKTFPKNGPQFKSNLHKGVIRSNFLISLNDFQIVVYKYLENEALEFAKFCITNTSLHIDEGMGTQVEAGPMEDSVFHSVKGQIGNMILYDLATLRESGIYKNKFTTINNDPNASYITFHVESDKRTAQNPIPDLYINIDISSAYYLHSQRFINGLVDILIDYSDCIDDIGLNLAQMKSKSLSVPSEKLITQTSNLKIAISANAPFIVLPISKIHEECLVIDLGQLTASNEIMECPSDQAHNYIQQLDHFIEQEPTCNDCRPQMDPSAFNWSVPNNDLKYTTSSLRADTGNASTVDSIKISLEKICSYIGVRQEVAENTAQNNPDSLNFTDFVIVKKDVKYLCDPFNLEVNIKRLLSMDVENAHPKFTASVNLSKLEFQIFLLDYCLIMGFLGYNLGEKAYPNDEFVLAKFRPKSQMISRKKIRESTSQDNKYLQLVLTINLDNVTFNLYDFDYVQKDSPFLFGRLLFSRSVFRYHSFLNDVTNIDLRCSDFSLIDLRFENETKIVSRKPESYSETLPKEDIFAVSFINRKTFNLNHTNPAEDISLLVKLNSTKIVLLIDFLIRFFDFILTPIFKDPLAKDNSQPGKSNSESSEILEVDEKTHESLLYDGLNTFYMRVTVKETDFILPHDSKLNNSDVLVVQSASCFDYVNENYLYFLDNKKELKSMNRRLRSKALERFSFRVHNGSFFSGLFTEIDKELVALKKVHIFQPTSIEIKMVPIKDKDKSSNHVKVTTSIVNGKFAYSDAVLLTCIISAIQTKLNTLQSLTGTTFPCLRCLTKDSDNAQTRRTVVDDEEHLDHIIIDSISFSIDSLKYFNSRLSIVSEGSFCLIDDCHDADVPLLEVNVSDLQFDWAPQYVKEGYLDYSLSINFYNRDLATWEPILETSWLKAQWLLEQGPYGQKACSINFSSEESINFNVTVPMLSLYKLVTDKLAQEKKELSALDSFERLKKRKPFVPFQLVNLTGEKICYKTEEIGQYSILDDSKTADLNFDVLRKDGKSVNYRNFTKFLPKLIIKVDGWKSAYAVAIDRLGIYFRTIERKLKQPRLELDQLPSYTRLVIEVVRLGSAQNQIIIRSALTITNNLQSGHKIILGYESINNLMKQKLKSPNVETSGQRFTESTTPINPVEVKTLSPGSTYSIPLNIVAMTSAKKGYLCFKPFIEDSGNVYKWSRYLCPNDDKNDFEVINLTRSRSESNIQSSYIDCFDWTNINEPGNLINRCLYSEREDPEVDYGLASISAMVQKPSSSGQIPIKKLSEFSNFGYNYSICVVRDVFPKINITDHGYYGQGTSFRLPFDLPGHHITISGIFKIKNLLPIDLAYQINQHVRGNIGPSKMDFISQINCFDKIEFTLKIDGYKTSAKIQVPDETIITQTTIRIFDFHDRPLDLEIFFNCIKHGAIHVTISAQYWIINKTGLPLIYSPCVTSGANEARSIDEALDARSIACLAAGQDNENECARQMSPHMFSAISNLQKSEENNGKTLQIRIGRKFTSRLRISDTSARFAKVWSQKLSIEKTAAYNVDLKLKTYDQTPDFIYQIGVKIRPGKGEHEKTKMIILNPRFVIENNTGFELQFIQKFFINKSNEDSSIISAQSGSSFTFHWPRYDCDHLLCFRTILQDNIPTIWSGGLQIDKQRNYVILTRPQSEMNSILFERDNFFEDSIRSKYESQLFHISILLEDATYHVSIIDANQLPSPFLIVNNTELHIKYHQKLPPAMLQDSNKQQPVFSIEPLSSCNYAPEEPLLDSILHLELRSGTFADYKLYDSVNSKNQFLHYVNLAYISFYKIGTDDVLPGFQLSLDTNINPQETPEDDIPWVLEVLPNTRVVRVAKKSITSDRQNLQLWLLTPSGHIFHYGSMSPHDPNEPVEKLFKSKLSCLDILNLTSENLKAISNNFNKNCFDLKTIKNFDICSLCINQYKEERSRYQCWKIDKNLSLYNEEKFVIQGLKSTNLKRSGQSGQVENMMVYAARPKKNASVLISSSIVPSSLRPIFQKPGNGTLEVSIDYENENGPTRIVQVDYLDESDFAAAEELARKENKKNKGMFNDLTRWNGDGWRYYLTDGMTKMKRVKVSLEEEKVVEKEKTFNKMKMSINLSKNIGISLINPFGEELIYASLVNVTGSLSRLYLLSASNARGIRKNTKLSSLDDFLCISEKAVRPTEKLNLKIKYVQIDSQYLGSNLPVLLFTETNFEDNFEASERRTSDSELITRKDKYNTIMIEYERPYTNHWKAHIFSFIKVTLGRIVIQAEEILILKLIEFFLATRSKSVDENETDEFSTLNRSSPTAITPINAKYIYTNNLEIRIAPLRISLQTLPYSKQLLDTNLHEAKKCLPFLINFTNAELKFGCFELKHNLETVSALGKRIKQYYILCLNSQYIQICGAVDFLGNPIGLFNDITTGINDLVELDVSGMFKNFTHGFSNAASKLINNVSNITNAASFDKKYLDKRSEILNPTKNMFFDVSDLAFSSSGKFIDFSKLPEDRINDFQMCMNNQSSHTVRNNNQHVDPFNAGINNLWHGIYGGATSLVTQPYYGLKEKKLKGLVYGVGKGMIGTFTKPLGGMLDFMSGAFASVSEAAKSSEKGRPKRIRPRRAGLSINQPIVPFDLADSIGQIVLIINLKHGALMPSLVPSVAHEIELNSLHLDSDDEETASNLEQVKKTHYEYTSKILYLTTGYANNKSVFMTLEALGIARLELVHKLLPCQWEGTVVLLTDRAIWCLRNDSLKSDYGPSTYEAITAAEGRKFNFMSCPLLSEKAKILFIIPYSRIDTCSIEGGTETTPEPNLFYKNKNPTYNLKIIGDFGKMKRVLPCDCKEWAESIVFSLKEAHFRFIQTAMSIHNRRLLSSLSTELSEHPFAMAHAPSFEYGTN